MGIVSLAEYLQNKPVPFSALFIQWVNVARRVMQHYSPVDLLKRVLTGKLCSVYSS